MDKFLKRGGPSKSHDEQNQSKKTQYCESYLKYGFSAIDDMPQCSVYYKVLCMS
jgi:hypothetical protein